MISMLVLGMNCVIAVSRRRGWSRVAVLHWRVLRVRRLIFEGSSIAVFPIAIVAITRVAVISNAVVRVPVAIISGRRIWRRRCAAVRGLMIGRRRRGYTV